MAITLSLAEINAYDPHEGQRRLCPLCGDSKPRDAAHRSLSFDARTGLWKCFRCGSSGLLKEFHTEKSENFSASRQEARARLRKAFELPEVPVEAVKNSPAVEEIPFSVESSLVESAPAELSWQARWEETIELAGSEGAKYLTRRGIAEIVAQAAEVRFAPSWFGHAAVVFPIRDLEKRLVAAQGRAVRGNSKLTAGPKRNGVFFAPAPKSATPMDDGAVPVFQPLDAALPAMIIVEAPIDALSLATCGFPAMALCGTSGPHWLHIACGLRRVLLAFDADEAGNRAADGIRPRLTSFGSRCERMAPENAKDWNEMLLLRGRDFLSDWLTERVLFASD